MKIGRETSPDLDIKTMVLMQKYLCPFCTHELELRWRIFFLAVHSMTQFD